MTRNQILHEMKLRIEAVRLAAEMALCDIERKDFSEIYHRLDQMKMYSDRAKLDLDASYKVA